MNDPEVDRLDHIAVSQKMYGDLAGARKSRQALEVILDKPGHALKKRIQNLNQLALLSVRLGDLVEAERSAKRSVSLCADSTDETKATCFMLLACVLGELGKCDEAVSYAERAIKLFECIYGSNNQFVVDRKNDAKRLREKQPGPYLDL